MNRNKLDNALLRKVEQTRIDPPSDMWDRIASTLSEQGLTAAGDTAGAASAAAKPGRPKTRRWRYAAAAAAAVICALVIGHRMNGVDNSIIVAETVAVEPAVLSIRTPAENETGIIAQATRGVETEPHLNHTTAAPEVDGTPKDTQSDEGEVAPISATTDRRRTQTKSSDMRSEGGVPVYHATDGAEAGRRDKRATPLSVSLYAGNFGAAKTVQNTAGGALRAASDEISEPGAMIMYGTRQSALSPPVSLKHKFPVSFGFTLSTGLTDRLAVESGLVYSYLYSESETPTTGNQYKHEQKLHYLGIPIGVKYDLFRRPLYSVYASAGGLVEMCVSGQYIQTLYNGGVAGISSTRRMNVYGIQSSVNMQVGAEFRMSRSFSLYLEPGVSYYFDNARQPENYRTENPINMSLKAGVRIRMN